MAQAGVPGYEFYAWFGMLAPARTPRPILQRLNEVLLKSLRVPETASQFEAQGADPAGNSPEEFAAYFKQEAAQYEKAIKAGNIAQE